MSRAAAYIIDVAILYPAGAIISMLFGPLSFMSLMLSVIIAASYQGWFLQSHWCATPGKRVMRIVVLRPDGSKLDLRGGLERYFCTLFPALPIYSNAISIELGMILSFWFSVIWFGLVLITEERTTLHDIICKTRVFEGKIS